MRLVTFCSSEGNPQAGLLLQDAVLNLVSLGFADALDAIAKGPEVLRSAAADPSASLIPLAAVRLLAPVLRPPRIFCIGLNYRDHAAEANMPIPTVPTVFLKLASAVIGPGETVRLPSLAKQPDYEVEFAAVIGKGGRKIAANSWQEHIFGYTILNDVSARDVQLATSQWILGKSFDTFCPIGPAVVTADEIPDPHRLRIQLSIEGETLQHSSTSELIFKLPELISYISSVTALEPGDIISTGTPAGVGMGRKPQRWLRPGEVMTAEIEGLGKLINPVAAGE